MAIQKGDTVTIRRATGEIEEAIVNHAGPEVIETTDGRKFEAAGGKGIGNDEAIIFLSWFSVNWNLSCVSLASMEGILPG